MKAIQITLYVVLLLAVCTISIGVSQGQEGQSSDERAIRAMYVQINRAMNAETAEKGVEIMKGIISDKAFTFVLPLPENPPHVIVGDKKEFLEALAGSLRDGPRWGTHEVHRISIVGRVAYEVGGSKGPDQDAANPGQNWLNVLVKEDAGWRIVYSTPADDVLKAMRQLDTRVGKSER